MNEKEIISIVAERSGMEPDDCTRVLNTLEDVLSEEITRSKWKNIIFGLLYSILTRIKNKKENMRESIL